MDLTGLKEKILELKIDTASFSLEEELPNEKYCLWKNNNVWEVYYSEKARKQI